MLKASQISNNWLLAMVLMATIASLFPALDNGWVNWDDPAYVRDNVLIHEISLGSIKKWFTTQEVVGLYHPFALASLAFDYAIAEEQAAWYHTHNLILHLLNTVLLFFLLVRLKLNRYVAAFTSLLFAIHPMHVESVAWVSARKDVLYCFFYFCALLIYVKQEKKSKAAWLAVLLLFICSLLAKPMAVTLPLALLLIDYLRKRQLKWQVFAEKLPFFLLSLIVGLAAISAQQNSGAMFELSDLKLSVTLFTSGYGLFMYLVKSLVPFQLSAFHPYPDLVNGQLVTWLYPFVSVLPVLLLGMFLLRKKRILFFGLTFFLVHILPVLQIISVGKAIMAERYTYIAYVGLFLCISQLIYSLVKMPISRNSVHAFVGLWLLFLGGTTFIRADVWQSNISLWTDVIAKYPNQHLAYCNRASSFYIADNTGSALADCNRCIELKPDLYESYNNRALVLLEMGDRQKALSDLNESLRLKPNYPEALFNRGVLNVKERRFQQAINDLNAFILLEPNHAKAHFNLALAFAQSGDFTAAFASAERAASIDSTDSSIRSLQNRLIQDLESQ